MRTVVSSTHPDPTRAVPPRVQHENAQPSPPPPIDNAALDPALADSIPPPMQYSPQVMPNLPPAPASAQQPQNGTLPPMQQLPPAPSGSASPPPPQYIATGAPASGAPSADGEWGDVPRLPPILQVEKQHVTTTATQAASASRRRNDAQFKCPVPGCGSTFTRRFNLRGHLRSHTEERPFICEWPNCNKGFARQHDCKRHYALHNAKPNQHVCDGCGKTFSRTDALNRHLRSDGGSGCRKNAASGSSPKAGSSAANTAAPVSEPRPTDAHPPGTLNGHYPISLAVQSAQPAPPDPAVHHPHLHQIPADLSSQLQAAGGEFLAGLLSGQQFLAAAAATGSTDPSQNPNPNHAQAYDGMVQGAPAPSGPGSEQAPGPVNVPVSQIMHDDGERAAKRRAVSVGDEIVPVPVAAAELNGAAKSEKAAAHDMPDLKRTATTSGVNPEPTAMQT
ncbi:hypothetical protein BDV93DRAFT_207549 [Ceratobasidium sp. AG-I]|nr:hypothetical protein BDV93DRAFT_207549 [Ceratobasidium sp. AG-I]